MRARQFSSDNASGACPEVMDAVVAANKDHAPSYGSDPLTARAVEAVRRLFRRDCDVFFTATGTAANALALAALSPPYGVVACTRVAHVYNDECGAPGHLGGGLQLRPFEAPTGKLAPAALDELTALRHVHGGRPSAVTLTQSSELGTVYALQELRALAETARRHDLKVHVDGARVANAAAGLGTDVGHVAEAADVDVLCLGGTKDGMLGAEAIVVFDRRVSEAVEYHRKRSGHLLSKHRFVAAQWVGALETGAWTRNAVHANAMAARLEAGARRLGLAPVYPRQANALFLALDEATRARMAERGWVLYDDPAWGGTRMVCSWDTTEADVDAFLADLRQAQGP